MDLAQFIDTYKDAIAQRVVESYPPLYRPSQNGHGLPQLLRSPLGAQADAIRGVTLSLKAHQGTNVVGEMGTGKTFIGASAAYAAGFRRVLVLTPPHLTRKWKREVEQTVPKARVAIVASITDLEKLRLSTGPGPLFAIMSRERAKLSYRWQAAYIEKWATSRGGLIRDEETGEPFRVPCCPICASPDRGQGRCAPHRRGDGAQAPDLRRVRLRPVAGRPQGAEAISTRGLHQEADEGVLRAARNRRGA